MECPKWNYDVGMRSAGYVSFVRAVVEEQRRYRPPQYLQVFAMPLGGLTRSRVCCARALGRCEIIRVSRRS
jgi:hypothetical protein